MKEKCSSQPLHMIIQGIVGIGKSYLIHCIRNALHACIPTKENPLIILAPTGIATFNIQASTIHAALRIPIREMKPLQGQALTTF